MELYEFIVCYCWSYWIIVELYELLGNFVTSTKICHFLAFFYGATYTLHISKKLQAHHKFSNLVTLKIAKVCSSAIRLIYDTGNCHILNMVPEMKTTKKWRWPQALDGCDQPYKLKISSFSCSELGPDQPQLVFHESLLKIWSKRHETNFVWYGSPDNGQFENPHPHPPP